MNGSGEILRVGQMPLGTSSECPPNLPDLEDPVNYELYENPGRLKCGHVFSETVLKELEARGINACPDCRQPTVTTWTNDFKMSNVVEQWKEHQKETKEKEDGYKREIEEKEKEREKADEERQKMQIQCDQIFGEWMLQQGNISALSQSPKKGKIPSYEEVKTILYMCTQEFLTKGDTNFGIFQLTIREALERDLKRFFKELTITDFSVEEIGFFWEEVSPYLVGIYRDKFERAYQGAVDDYLKELDQEKRKEIEDDIQARLAEAEARCKQLTDLTNVQAEKNRKLEQNLRNALLFLKGGGLAMGGALGGGVIYLIIVKKYAQK